MPPVTEQITPDGIPIPSTAPEPKVVVETSESLPPSPNMVDDVDDGKPVETEEIDFDDFHKIKETQVKKEPAKPRVEETEEVKEEPKVEDVPKVEPKVQPKVKQTEQRDYTGIPEADIPLTKQMSNEAFKRFRTEYTEHAKVKAELAARDVKISELEKGITKLPDSYYEDPKAFVLTPEFVTASNQFSEAQSFLDHWKEQFINLKNGAEKVVNKYYDGKEWKTEEVEATPRVEAFLLEQMNNAQQLVHSSKNALTQLSNHHRNKVNEARQWLSETESKLFPNFDQPEHKEKYAPFIQDVISKLHPTFQKSPLAPAFAKALVVLNEMNNLIKQSSTPKVIPEIKKAAGPTEAEATSDVGGKKSSSDDVTWDTFQSLKNRD